MKMPGTRRVWQSCLYFALVFGLVACGSSGSGGGFSPQVASPPPFDYADGAILRSRMHQLAYASQRLDLALLDQGERGIAAQLEIVSTLRDIERIASELEAGDLSTTHQFLRNDMQNFQAAVNRALRNAERNPPNFYPAGQVTGSCVNCHRSVQ